LISIRAFILPDIEHGIEVRTEGVNADIATLLWCGELKNDLRTTPTALASLVIRGAVCGPFESAETRHSRRFTIRGRLCQLAGTIGTYKAVRALSILSTQWWRVLSAIAIAARQLEGASPIESIDKDEVLLPCRILKLNSRLDTTRDLTVIIARHFVAISTIVLANIQDRIVPRACGGDTGSAVDIRPKNEGCI